LKDSISIRVMQEADCALISQGFADQGWDKPISQYLRYLRESKEGLRVVLLAEYDGQFAGYLTIVWESTYPPFRTEGIPEIVDFNVLQKYRRLGVGRMLMDEAERRMAERSPIAGIGVGVTADYGAAQVLYVKRGYVPDGRGLFQNGQHVRPGEQVRADDSLVLYFARQLWTG
jgi:GNAT superfamily N-acetyltransferase